MIEIRGLTKYYGDALVLDRVDLDVARGEAVVLIGASGSGKSTLLRCINGLVSCDYGEIRLDGRLLHSDELSAKELRERTGIVFQSYNLFPTMTVLRNIILAPCKVHGVSTAEATRDALELLERLNMREFADAYPEQLSGGQQQRVAVARAMANRPDILLLDEITAALDPELIGGVLQLIADLKMGGITMVIVTHEMGFARDVADRVCFLDSGRIVEMGPPAELLTRPEHPRTQQFLQRIIESGRL